jgi:dolichyl-phosphate-mannose--protein O-mannosyl transferase
MLTFFGASALTFMMLMYALERRHRLFVLAFAVGCALSSAYGFLAGTWPFGVVELLWVLIAFRRYFTHAVGRPLTGPRRAAR